MNKKRISCWYKPLLLLLLKKRRLKSLVITKKLRAAAPGRTKAPSMKERHDQRWKEAPSNFSSRGPGDDDVSILVFAAFLVVPSGCGDPGIKTAKETTAGSFKLIP